jgi:metal-sulfur cluster biosynthetic enzyme
VAPEATTADVYTALHDVIDPELGYNIVDLGLVYDAAIADGTLRVTMTMTTPGCPAQDYIKRGVFERAMAIPGVGAVDVEVVWEPRWSPRRMSAAAKAHFGIAGDAP